jgi:hypothetical protein
MIDIDEIMREEKFYLDCIRNLLHGLKINEIDYFMSRLTPENCLKLGTAYGDAAKRAAIPFPLIMWNKK